jgi:hypothetical protein
MSPAVATAGPHRARPVIGYRRRRTIVDLATTACIIADGALSGHGARQSQRMTDSAHGDRLVVLRLRWCNSTCRTIKTMTNTSTAARA